MSPFEDSMTANTDAKQPVMDRALMVVAAVVVLGAIMSILDTTVVNVALNTLARHFHTKLATVQWVATGYTLALATVIPLTGWAADRFGTKRLYLATIALFVTGSALAGLAWSSETIILFRVLQGLGGGMLMPVGMTILTRAAGPQRVGRVMGVIGVPMLIGPILGPILGGWLVQDLSWRWIFFINLPIGIAAFITSTRVLPRDAGQPGVKLDWVGLATLSPSLALIIYGLAESSSHGGFGHAQVLVPIAIGAVLFVAFIAGALKRPAIALIDLRLFKNKVYSGAMATMFLMIIAVFGAMLLIPLYLQSVRGESALTTGLLLAPQGLGAMISMPIGGRLTDRIGIGRFVPAGLALVALTFIPLTQIGAHTSYVLLGIDLFFMGLGIGLAMMPTFSGAIQTLRRADIARASSALNINQQVGASFGTAILSVLLASRLIDHLGHGPGSGIGGTLPAAVRATVAPKMAEAYSAVFVVALVLVIISTLVAALLLPKHKPEPVEDPDAAAVEAPPAVLV
ncbi:MAG TPA: DHA2 family efflux MFS transporter permease subunit [Solirubrobacteraceae bacterium]|jgi:EmrB/QacA subfamily drug resistance transporter|nr:DHA2 family efflux MFS transporter permease subunit [Solirubrobacteraceae bacterium]